MDINEGIEKTKERATEIFNTMTDTSNTILVFYYLIGMIILFIIFIGFYISKEILKKNRNDKSMKRKLEQVENIVTNINTRDAKHKHKLRDYYILSSHNSCSNGDYSNGYVTLDALKTVIKRGARLLDFEVYSVGGNTVIASSYEKTFFRKGTYNSLSFPRVMETIQRHAFSASTCPNYNDPLLLHFRVNSQREKVFNDMTKNIMDIFGSRLLGLKYGNEYNGENLGTEKLENLLGKVIIIYDSSNPLYKETKFSELVNIASSSVFLRKTRDQDIRYAPSYKDLIENNKKNMNLTMNNLQKSSRNMDPGIHIKYGCQMIAMNFQNVDSNLIYYLDFFNKGNSAFILKPKELRYIPVVVDSPQAQDPKLSYAPKQISKPYFSAKV